MEAFKHGKKEVTFRKITGEVLGTEKYCETDVYSSGGGGYVGESGGYVSAPTIDSITTTHHEFWIRKEDGFEESIKLCDTDIPLRCGQKISIISASLKGSNHAFYSILVNHNANKHWFIRKAEELNKYFRIERFTGKSLLITGAVTILGIKYLEVPVHFAMYVAILFLVYRLIVKICRKSRLKKGLNKHLENLAQLSYKN